MGDVVRRQLGVHSLFGRSAIFLAVLMSFVSVSAASDTKRGVLVFKPWSDNARSICVERLRQSPWRLEISDHSLMFARFSDENSENAFVEVFTPFAVPAARGQNAGQSSPVECQP